ncbi:MAG: hypothetical protein K2X81_16140 [Candidatus Obscuribacterales bacterium]|nr:hypothetical protein [Candidatus Obscuribacterales bacterium]
MSDTKLSQEAVLKVAWPTPQDFSEAIQNPQDCFSDPDLINGNVSTDALGLPRVASGMFASVYKLNTNSSSWAVRCFLRNLPETLERYVVIEQELQKVGLSSTVEFDMQEEGIRVHNRNFPMLKMQWCSGISLTAWLEKHLNDPASLKHFLDRWQDTIAELQNAGIAHGDLQHGNILIDKEKLRLVDYDGMYVPSLAGKESCEIGHRNYQHPQRDKTHFGPYLDNFAASLIYFSIKILCIDNSLWERLAGGDECILFRAQDLQNPIESEAFGILEQHPLKEIRRCSWIIRDLLRTRIDLLPSLSEVLQWDYNKIDQLEAELPSVLPPGISRFNASTRTSARTEHIDDIENESAPWWASHVPNSSAQNSQNPQTSTYQTGFIISPQTIAALIVVLASILGTFFCIESYHSSVTKANNQQLQAQQAEKLSRYARTLEYARHAENTATQNNDNLATAQNIYTQLVDQFKDGQSYDTPNSANNTRLKLLEQAEQGLFRVTWERMPPDQQIGEIRIVRGKSAAAWNVSSAEIAHSQKDFQKAIKLYGIAIAESPAQTPFQKLALADIYSKIADVQLEAGQKKAAQNSALEAVHIYRKVLGYNCTTTLESCLRLCQISEEINELPYAKIAYERLMQLSKDKPLFEEIYKQAKEAHQRVENILAKTKTANNSTVTKPLAPHSQDINSLESTGITPRH